MENNNTDRSAILKKALEEIRFLKKKVEENKSADFEPIAVVGIACRFPKGVTTPSKFWKALEEQKDLVSPLPEKRHKQTMGGKWAESPFLKEAGYLDEDIEGFDHRLFRFSPREAERTDPQQRLFLKVCWEALENAGYAPDSLRGSNTGVYAGVMLMEYTQQLDLERKLTATVEPYDVPGNGFSFTSGRASYFFGFQGPGISTDSACASSLVSIDNACKGLWMGDCEMALAGGVNLLQTQEFTALFSSLNILSPDCRSKSFDASANGTVRGEGCGVVVLKKLSVAERDGDHIHAVIKATGVNQAGLSSGPTVPHGPTQQALLKKVWEKADLEAEGPDYIEAHGTGTEIGDPIEMNAIINLLPKERKVPVYVGTVKSNAGHLEAAAGVAGFIKTVLALEHKKIPGNLHFENPSTHINWSESAISVPQKTIAWDNPSDKPRNAAVSSFGLSGTNVHVVLEEYLPASSTSKTSQSGLSRKLPIRFSARSRRCLRDQLLAFASFLEEHDKIDMESLSYSHNVSRADFKEKHVIWADSKEELKTILDAVISDESNSGSIPGLWRTEDDFSHIDVPPSKTVQQITYQEASESQELESHVFGAWVKGVKIDWKKYYRGSGIRKIVVPNYRFREKIFAVAWDQSERLVPT